MGRVLEVVGALMLRALRRLTQGPPPPRDARTLSSPVQGRRYVGDAYDEPVVTFAIADEPRRRARYTTRELERIHRALSDDPPGFYEQMRSDSLRPEAPAWRAERTRLRTGEFADCFREEPVELPVFFRRLGLDNDFGSRQARERGLRLLEQNLSPSQRAQFSEQQYFEVVGGNTGRRYRIRHGRVMNIDLLDQYGVRIGSLCFYPRGGLVAGDIMLAQKLALELFEADALKVANRV
jgi:hypothetical protein